MSERPQNEERPDSPLKRALLALEQMRARLSAVEHAQREPIAVIGIGCRFPGGGTDPESFMRNLLEGRDAVREIPAERWSGCTRSAEEIAQLAVRHAALVDNIHYMDAQFFGASAHAARHMDPQQKMLLEVTWEALEHAGLPPADLDDSRTGVFNGLWAYDYWTRLLERKCADLTGFEPESMHSFAAGRQSYGLNLHGPSFVVDTACSTSLVTAHLACQSLRAGECDVALAGGVNVILDPALFHVFALAKVLSPDGRCKAFDASADGFGRGEGCGVVVLKRYNDAVEAGDRILALIRGSAVNHDGRGTQLAVPNADAQQMAYRQALAQAGVRPGDVKYVEAHGTGTAVGDPAELEAIAAVYCEGRDAGDPLLVGSVKTNIGHLESAAGVAGLIKTVLALHAERIPGNLHFKKPNPAIAWESLPVRVPDRAMDWPRSARPRLAAVSAFGITGTNAHIVLEEAPLSETRSATRLAPRRYHALCLSAKGARALDALSTSYEQHLRLRRDQPIEDVCFTANTGRAHFRDRLCVVGATHEELADRLAKLRGNVKTPFAYKRRIDAQPPQIAFLFTGQGAQYAGMGKVLYEAEPRFRDVIDRCEARYRELRGISLLDVMHASAQTDTRIDATEFTQPALYALECALAAWLGHLGLVPAVVLGHSVGEYAAACVAGVFSLEQGLELIARRGELMQALPREGAMASVLAGAEDVQEAIAPYRASVAIAAMNTRSETVISGQAVHVQEVLDDLARRGIEAKLLRVSHAFHSPLVEPMTTDFLASFGAVSLAPPAIALISNVTGTSVDGELANPAYWAEHIRKPVRFADGVRAARARGCNVFLEVGPSPTLIGFARRTLEDDGACFVTCLQRGKDDCQAMLGALAELHVNGARVDWRALDRGRGHRKVTLPSYPFQRQRYEIVPAPRTDSTDLDAAVRCLLASTDRSKVIAAFQGAGGLSPERAGLAAGLLSVLADNGANETTARRSIAAEYYNALPAAMSEIATGAARDNSQGFLTFGPFDEALPGFSWIRAIFDPNIPPAHLEACRAAQRRLRASLFRHVDFSGVRRALDFGCGYGSDLIELAQRHSHLNCFGYTIAGNQAAIASQKAAAQGLSERVRIYNKDSAAEPFPGEMDLVFGFEVAHHIRDKNALFANVQSALRDGALLVLADFISHTGFSIDHEESSSYFITLNEWVDVLSAHQLCVVDSIDISPEIANFLHDPAFDANFDMVEPFRRDANIRASFKSYDQLGRLLKEKLASYVLVTARKRSDLDRVALAELNQAALSNPVPYASTTLGRAFYELAWRPAEPDRAGLIEPGERWLILADRGGVGRELAAILSRRGVSCVLARAGAESKDARSGEWFVDPANAEDFRKLVRVTVNGSRGFNGVVQLWTLDVPQAERLTGAELEALQASICAGTLHAAQALVESSHPGRLWVATSRAQAIAVGDRVDGVAAATVNGLCLSMAWEHPDRFGAVVDLDPATPAAMAQALADVLDSGTNGPLLALREGVWQAGRLVRGRVPDGIFAADPQGAYLITGGLGALGRKVAEWLAAAGAKHLALVSRGAHETTQPDDFVAGLRARGIDVRIARADAADEAQIAPVMQQIRDAGVPLRGVFHAAGVLDDATLLEQSWQRFTGVLAAKVQGAWNLHRSSRADNLHCFVCFSSASSMLGSPGQSNYAAANAFLDALAWHRRSLGLPALTVNWGAWGEAGMAARLSETQRKQLAAKGLRQIPPAAGLAALGALLADTRSQVGIIPIDWSRLRDAIPQGALTKFLGEVLPAGAASSVRAGAKEGTAETGATPLAAIRTLRGAERRKTIVRLIKERVATVLGFDESTEFDEETTLLDLGFDSLMAVQLRNRIRNDFGIDVEFGRLLQTAGVQEIGRMLEEQLALGDLMAASEGEESASSARLEII